MPVHILRNCVGLAKTRFLVLGLENPRANCYIEKFLKMVGPIKSGKSRDSLLGQREL